MRNHPNYPDYTLNIPNKYMARLYREYMCSFDDWAKPIKVKAFGGVRKLDMSDSSLVGSGPNRPPYDVPLSKFIKFYPSLADK